MSTQNSSNTPNWHKLQQEIAGQIEAQREIEMSTQDKTKHTPVDSWTLGTNTSSKISILSPRGELWEPDSEYLRTFKSPEALEPVATFRGSSEIRKANAAFVFNLAKSHSQLVEALKAIRDNDLDHCECDHTDENCCVTVGEHCAWCIADRALKAAEEQK